MSNPFGGEGVSDAARQAIEEAKLRKGPKRKKVLLDPLSTKSLRPKKENHNQRTVKYIEKTLGMRQENCEHVNPWSGKKRDFLNLFDRIAFGEMGIFGIQVTSRANISARRKKFLDSKELVGWLNAGGKAWIIGWAKEGYWWRPTIESYFLRDGKLEYAEITFP